MYCPNCGKKLKKSYKFCGNCGARLDKEEKISLVNVKEKDKAVEGEYEELEYAGFLIRLGAYLIDILGIIMVIFILIYFFGLSSDLHPFFWNYFPYVFYNTLTLTIWSTTLGKNLYGLRVVSLDKKDLTFKQALIRSLLQPFSTFLFGIGYWNMNKNPKNQAWHDKQANTIIVKRKKNLTPAYLMTIIAVLIWAYLIYIGEYR